MEEKDLKQITEVVEKGFSKAFIQVWEHNLEPAFEAVYKRFDEQDKRFDGLDGKISQLPTKTFLTDKLADLQGDLTTKLRKEDEKVNRLLDILRTKNVLSESDLAELAHLVVFPK